ncbi:MAG: helix-turn-helix transcriptional regulator [Clostridia bacterium]|nr:helix-turn-helix transcriptional regulator [Clostridia bacterium]
MTTLGRRLRAMRIERGLSQAQVAGTLTRAAVSAVELGHIWPSVDTLDTMTRGLGLPDGYFYELYLSETDGEAHLLAFGQRCFERGMGDLARRAMAKLVAISRSKGRNRMVTEVLWRLGLWALAEGRTQTALATFQACLDRAMAERDWARVVRIHLRLAELEQAEGRRVELLERLMTARHLLAWVEEEERELRLAVQRRLGDLCLEMDFLDLAREYYQAAWQELAGAPGEAGTAPGLEGGAEAAGVALALADVHRRRGEAAEALRWGELAARLFAELGDEEGRARAQALSGGALADLGRFGEAREALLEALQLLAGGERVRPLVDLVGAELALGGTATARQYAAEALELAGDEPRLRGCALRAHALALREAGAVEEAFEGFLESTALLAGAGGGSDLRRTLCEAGRALAEAEELRGSGFDRFLRRLTSTLGVEAESRTA